MPSQDQKPQWAIFFKVDDATWAKLCAAAEKRNASALDTALDAGLINESELIQWDRQLSNIPALKPEFFDSVPPIDLFKKFEYEKCRVKACIPVTEWNGNIYWAKLSSEGTGFEAPNSQHLWFIAPWSGIKKWFNAWRENLTNAVKAESEPSFNIPPAISSSIAPPLNSPPPVPVTFPAPIPAPVVGEPEVFSFGQETNAGASQSNSFTGTELRILPELSIDMSAPPKTEVELPSDDLHGQRIDLAPPPFTSSPAPLLAPVPQPPPHHSGMPPIDTEQTFVEPRPETIILEGSFTGAGISQMPPHPPPPFPSPAPAPLRPAPAPQAVQGPQPPQLPQVPQAAPIPQDEDLSHRPSGLGTFNKEATAAIDFSSLMSGDNIEARLPSPQPEAALPPLPVHTPSEISLGSLDLESAPPGPLPVPGEEVLSEPPLTPMVSQAAPPPVPKSSPTTPASMPPPPVPVPETANEHSQTKSEGWRIGFVPPNQFESRMRLAVDQDSLANVLMGNWQNYFEQVMILLLQQDRLIVWWHNYKFIGQFNRGDTVSLETPSVFKIAVDSLHPYHGYVAPSPVNDAFFKTVSNGEYPEHLTLVPVVAGERVVAMLLGICSKDAAKSLVIQKLETDAQLFATSILRLSAPTRQAG